MGRHVARETTTTRGKLALGVVAALVALTLLLGSQGSLAFWRTSGTVPGATFDSGTIDLTVDGQQGKGAGYAVSSLTIANMLPGETIAATVKINNAGTSDFSWVPTATTTGDLSKIIEVSMTVGGSVAGQATTYPRNQTCSGTTLVSGTTKTRLNLGATSQVLCVQVTLPLSAPSSAQGASGVVSVALAAQQQVTAR